MKKKEILKESKKKERPKKNGETPTLSNRQTDRKEEGQTDSKTDSQSDRETDRRTDKQMRTDEKGQSGAFLTLVSKWWGRSELEIRNLIRNKTRNSHAGKLSWRAYLFQKFRDPWTTNMATCVPTVCVRETE